MITTDTNKIIYVSDGTTTEYDFSFTVYNAGDIKVYITDLNNNITQLSETDYTVSLNDDYTGKITLTSPQPANYKIAIMREVNLTQETHYVEGDPFPAQAHERALDKLTMITQQLKEKVDRALTMSIFDDNTIDPEDFYNTLKFCEVNFDTYQDVKNTVGDNIDNVNTVGNNIDNVNITAQSIDNVNTYAKTYLGAKDTEPTIRNDGTALQVGDMYFDTVSKKMRVWSGSSWVDSENNVILTDISTGNQYTLFIDNGNLGIEEV